MSEIINRILQSRAKLTDGLPRAFVRKEAAEGGCGVVGFACSIPVGGRHIYEPSCQMHNRGNGKGGGIAAVGFVPEQVGVTRKTINTIETGRFVPSTVLALKLARAFGVSVEELFELE